MANEPTTEGGATNKPPVSQATRRQAVKQLHEKKAAERKQVAEALSAHYVQLKDDPAMIDILEKAKQFANWHLKLAKDGIGAKNMGKDEDGKDIVEDVYLTQEQRISELDQCKGIEQLISYIEQKIA